MVYLLQEGVVILFKLYHRVGFISIVCRELAQYFRSRKHVGLKRSVSFYEYIRAFAALRGSKIQTKPSEYLGRDKDFKVSYQMLYCNPFKSPIPG